MSHIDAMRFTKCILPGLTLAKNCYTMQKLIQFSQRRGRRQEGKTCQAYTLLLTTIIILHCLWQILCYTKPTKRHYICSILSARPSHLTSVRNVQPLTYLGAWIRIFYCWSEFIEKKPRIYFLEVTKGRLKTYILMQYYKFYK